MFSCRDICPIMKNPASLTAVIDLLEEHVRKNHQQVDLIVGEVSNGHKLQKSSTFTVNVSYIFIPKT